MKGYKHKAIGRNVFRTNYLCSFYDENNEYHEREVLTVFGKLDMTRGNKALAKSYPNYRIFIHEVISHEKQFYSMSLEKFIEQAEYISNKEVF